jgi:hypothetical protein
MKLHESEQLRRTQFTGFDSEKSKGFLIVCGGLAVLLAIIATALHIRDALAAQGFQGFEQVAGIVTESFVNREGSPSAVSNIQFELNGQTHTIRHYSRLNVGWPVDVLVDAKNPQSAVLLLDSSRAIDTLFGIAGVFGVITMFWLVIFIISRKRDKKMSQSCSVSN